MCPSGIGHRLFGRADLVGFCKAPARNAVEDLRKL